MRGSRHAERLATLGSSSGTPERIRELFSSFA